MRYDYECRKRRIPEDARNAKRWHKFNVLSFEYRNKQKSRVLLLYFRGIFPSWWERKKSMHLKTKCYIHLWPFRYSSLSILSPQINTTLSWNCVSNKGKVFATILSPSNKFMRVAIFFYGTRTMYNSNNQTSIRDVTQTAWSVKGEAVGGSL